MRPDPAVGDGVGVGMHQRLDIAGLGVGQGGDVMGHGGVLRMRAGSGFATTDSAKRAPAPVVG